jgi:hypothetical protein
MVRSSPIQARSARQPMRSSWRMFGATAYDDSATTILLRCSSPVANAVIRLRRASGFMGLLLPGTHESVGT